MSATNSSGHSSATASRVIQMIRGWSSAKSAAVVWKPPQYRAVDRDAEREVDGVIGAPGRHRAEVLVVVELEVAAGHRDRPLGFDGRAEGAERVALLEHVVGVIELIGRRRLVAVVDPVVIEGVRR